MEDRLEPREHIPGLDSILNGDPAGFEEFVIEYNPLIKGCVKKRADYFAKEDREDLIQGTYAYLADNDFEVLRSFEGKDVEEFLKFVWSETDNFCRRGMYAINKENEVIDRYVSQEAMHDLGYDSDTLAFATTDTPEDILIEMERNVMLEAAMAELPERYSEVLWMAAEGKTHSEIAEELGKPKGTIDSSAKRGAEQLKKIIRRKQPELLEYVSES